MNLIFKLHNDQFYNNSNHILQKDNFYAFIPLYANFLKCSKNKSLKKPIQTYFNILFKISFYSQNYFHVTFDHSHPTINGLSITPKDIK